MIFGDYVYSYWISLLTVLGLYKKQATILLLGLDNAGKTTLAYALKHGSIKSFIPTQRAYVEEVSVGSIRFRAWDLGGHEAIRSTWTDYFIEADAIVYLIDSSDPDRFEESAIALKSILNANDLLEDIPVVILCNKIDVEGFSSIAKIANVLNIPLPSSNGLLPTINSHPVNFFACSIIKNIGYQEAFQWIGSKLK